MKGVVDLKEKSQGDILIIQVKGRLDALSSAAAEKRVMEWIHNGHHHLLLDFAHVDYLSSAGMRTLLCVTKKLKALSGQLVVCAVTANVMDVLKISGFDHVLDLAASQEEGLHKFGFRFA